MGVPLSSHFTYKNIFKITIAPILMMIFTSLYGIVDGFFISNYAGPAEYAGVNLIMPIIMIIGGIGFMYGTGGSALSAKYLGEGNREMANKVFSMMFIFTLISGVIISCAGYFLIEPVAQAMGSITKGTTQEMVDQAILYGKVLVVGQCLFMSQNLFQSFFMVDEKPKLGFLCTIAAGVANMILDWLFIGIFGWGVVGAAVATIVGYVVGSIIPIVYFLRVKTGNICLVKTGMNPKVILSSCGNGSSEFVNNVSTCIVGIVFNVQLLKYYGQNGVSAYGTIMYVCFIFVAIFIGYSIGMAPVVSFNYGAKNHAEQKNVLKKSIIIIGITSVLMVIACIVSAPFLAKLYCGYDAELMELTTRVLVINAISFFFMGFSIYFSSFFTALNNGVISAVISFIRTIIFKLAFVFLFPALFGGEGIWWSMIAAELISMVISFVFLILNQKRYRY